VPGGGQEKKVRGGTENTAGIVGFGVAARLARERLVTEPKEIARLRDRLERGILESVAGARAVGAGAPRLPNTAAILFEGVPGDALLFRLDLEGVAVSVGSACSSGTLAPALFALAPHDRRRDRARPRDRSARRGRRAGGALDRGAARDRAGRRVESVRCASRSPCPEGWIPRSPLSC
jgi:hypothetical protein